MNVVVQTLSNRSLTGDPLSRSRSAHRSNIASGINRVESAVEVLSTATSGLYRCRLKHHTTQCMEAQKKSVDISMHNASHNKASAAVVD